MARLIQSNTNKIAKSEKWAENRMKATVDAVKSNIIKISDPLDVFEKGVKMGQKATAEYVEKKFFSLPEDQQTVEKLTALLKDLQTKI